jgi:molybdopterin-guanine dinucleotide biosynthesis protein A
MRGFALTPQSIPAVILAGGRSSRMGSNKAFAILGSETLLARVARRVAPQAKSVTLNADPDWPDALGLDLVADPVEGKAGPLAGVLAALLHTIEHHPTASHVATVAVDSPFFPPDLIATLADSIRAVDEIAVATCESREHSVFGLWPVSAADDLRHFIAEDEKRRVRGFLERHAVKRVNFPAIETLAGRFDPFFNVNAPDDLIAARAWLEALEG